MNKKEADLLIEEIQHGLETRTDLVNHIVNYGHEYNIEAVPDVISELLSIVDLIDADADLKVVIKEQLKQKNITSKTLSFLCQLNNSKVKTIDELVDKVHDKIKNPSSKHDRLVDYVVSEITVSVSSAKYAPSTYVESFNKLLNGIGIKSLAYNPEFIPFSSKKLDENSSQHTTENEDENLLANVITTIKKVFKFDVQTSLNSSLTFSKKTLFIPNALLLDENKVINSLKLLQTACTNYFNVSLATLMEASFKQRNVKLFDRKYSILEENNKVLVDDLFTQLVQVLTVASVARFCFEPKTYKNASLILQHNTMQLVRNLSEIINEPGILYLAAKQARYSTLQIFKTLKITPTNLAKLYNLTGVKYKDKENLFNVLNILTKGVKQVVEFDIEKLNDVDKAKPFDIKLIDKNVFYKKCCEKYANELDLSTKRRRFVLNQSFDNVEQNKKITFVEQMCKDLNITIESFENLTLEQTRIVIDAYAYSNVAMAKLEEIREKFFKLTNEEQLGLTAGVQEEVLEETPTTTVEQEVIDNPDVSRTEVVEINEEDVIDAVEVTEPVSQPVEESEEKEVVEETPVVEEVEKITEVETPVVEETPVIEETPVEPVVEEVEEQSVVEETPVIEVPQTPKSTPIDTTTPKPYHVNYDPTYAFTTDYTRIKTLEDVKTEVAAILYNGLLKSINLLANKDLAQMGSKIKYSTPQTVAQVSTLIASLNMLFNMKDSDKTVRNMFIAQNKREQAVGLINLKNGLENQVIKSLVNMIVEVINPQAQQINEETVINALIDLNEKHYADVEDSRLAEIEVVNLYEVPGTFEYQDAVDKINEEYFGNEEQAGKLVIAKNNLITSMFIDIIITESLLINSSAPYKFNDKHLDAIMRSIFAPVTYEEEETK